MRCCISGAVRSCVVQYLQPGSSHAATLIERRHRPRAERSRLWSNGHLLTEQHAPLAVVDERHVGQLGG